MSIERLIREHEYLDALAGRLERCVSSHDPDAAEAIAIKSQLSTSLADHLAGEDASIYPRLADSANSPLVATGEQMRGELAALKVDWTAYLREWPNDAIEQDWETFGEETRAMMVRLRARIAQENACLLPLALQHSIVRLRAAA